MGVEACVWIVDQAEKEMEEDQKGLGSGMKVETGGLRCFTKNMARIDEGPEESHEESWRRRGRAGESRGCLGPKEVGCG